MQRPLLQAILLRLSALSSLDKWVHELYSPSVLLATAKQLSPSGHSNVLPSPARIARKLLQADELEVRLRELRNKVASEQGGYESAQHSLAAEKEVIARQASALVDMGKQVIPVLHQHMCCICGSAEHRSSCYICGWHANM